MGLDAVVRCRCWEDGLCSEPPVPRDDVYIDEDGYISSRTLDKAWHELNYDEFIKRYDSLDRSFDEWCQHACVHEDMEICDERIGNWSGVGELNYLIERAGRRRPFPILSHMIPDGNGGQFPARLASAALEEFDVFVQVIAGFNKSWLVNVTSGEQPTVAYPHEWKIEMDERESLASCKVVVPDRDGIRHEFRRFRQEPLRDEEITGETEYERRKRREWGWGDWPVRLIDLDTGDTAIIAASLDVDFAGKPAEYRFEEHRAPYMSEDGTYWRAEVLRRLLKASLETGNPIQWC